MATQYEKRKARDRDTASIRKEIEDKRTEMRETATRNQTPDYTHTAYDVITLDAGKSYKVVEISFNPLTGQAEMSGMTDISRLIGLKYEGQKIALGLLKKKGR